MVHNSPIGFVDPYGLSWYGDLAKCVPLLGTIINIFSRAEGTCVNDYDLTESITAQELIFMGKVVAPTLTQDALCAIGGIVTSPTVAGPIAFAVIGIVDTAVTFDNLGKIGEAGAKAQLEQIKYHLHDLQ